MKARPMLLGKAGDQPLVAKLFSSSHPMYQHQILEASRLGQTDRVMELLRLKLESERKRTGF